MKASVYNAILSCVVYYCSQQKYIEDVVDRYIDAGRVSGDTAYGPHAAEDWIPEVLSELIYDACEDTMYGFCEIDESSDEYTRLYEDVFEHPDLATNWDNMVVGAIVDKIEGMSQFEVVYEPFGSVYVHNVYRIN